MVSSNAHARDPRRKSDDVYGNAAVGGGTVSELALLISSPTLDPAGSGEGAGVIIPSTYARDPRRKSDDVYGNAAVGGGTVSETTVSVVSPALDPAGSGEGAGAMHARGYLSYSRRKSDDVYGNAAIRGGTVSETTVSVVSPALDPAGSGEGAGVGISHAESFDTRRKAGNISRNGASGSDLMVCIISETIISIKPPTFSFSSGSNGTGCVHSSTHLRYARRKSDDVHRNGGICSNADSELAESVRPPALWRSRNDGADIVGSNGNPGNPRKTRNDNGDRRISNCTVTELSICIPSPAFHYSGRKDCAGCGVSCENLFHARRKSDDVYGNAAIRGGIVSELANMIKTPTLDPAGSGEGAGVMGSDAYSLHARRKSDDVYGNAAIRGGIVSETTVSVVSPALDPAGSGEGAGAIVSDAYSLHARRKSDDVYGNAAIRGGIVSELAAYIVSPALDPAGSGEGAGMGMSRRNV